MLRSCSAISAISFGMALMFGTLGLPKECSYKDDSCLTEVRMTRKVKGGSRSTVMSAARAARLRGNEWLTCVGAVKERAMGPWRRDEPREMERVLFVAAEGARPPWRRLLAVQDVRDLRAETGREVERILAVMRAARRQLAPDALAVLVVAPRGQRRADRRHHLVDAGVLAHTDAPRAESGGGAGLAVALDLQLRLCGGPLPRVWWAG